jgi:hypothetical protein
VAILGTGLLFTILGTGLLFKNQMTIEQFNGQVLKRIREIEQEMAAV